MSSGPIELTDDAGVTRFKGTSKPAPGGSTADLAAVLGAGNDGGGIAIVNIADGVDPQDVATVGQLPTVPPSPVQGLYTLGAVTIANGADAKLPFAYFGGAALLDLTDPLNPLFTAPGIYAVTAAIRANSALTAGGFFEVVAQIIDNSGNGPAIRARDSEGRCLVTAIAFGGTANPTSFDVSNHDGVNAVQFAGVGPVAIVKLS